MNLASIVIPTFNRKERLSRVLLALDRQTVDPSQFEVVIVDDGSSDGTREWLAEQRRAYTLRAISQKNGGPARARNTAIHAAQGRYLVFLDDDVEPVDTFLAEHLACQARNPSTVVLGPLSSLRHYRQPWVAWEQAKLELQYQAMIRGDWAPTFRQFWTGNASVERAPVLSEGGFNVEFLRGEDVELGFRLHQRGLKFLFHPQAQGFHHAERSLESWAHAHESYGRLEVEVFRKDGEEHLVTVLGENWRRLHPATRLLVKQCLRRPWRYNATAQAMKSVLRAQSALRAPMLSLQLCSVLANLLYWQASVTALGPSLAARVVD